MLKIKVNSKEYNFDPEKDNNLMQQLVSQGAEIVSACGGAGICQTCSFKPLSGSFTKKTDTEKMMDLPDGQRLSCQCKPEEDGEIEMIY